MLNQAQTHGCGSPIASSPTVVPNVTKLELNIGEPALEITPAEAAELFATVVAHEPCSRQGANR